MQSSPLLRRWGLVAALLLAAGTGIWLYRRWTVAPLVFAIALPEPVENGGGGRMSVRFPGYFVTRVATFHDELFAYLMYQHYRATLPFKGTQLVLYFSTEQGEGHYAVDLIFENDFIDAVNRAAELNAGASIEGFQWTLVSARNLAYRRSQTQLFAAAYNMPVRRRMEDLSHAELQSLLRRFIRFKSTTDPRVRKKVEPVPRILASGDAQRLAGDIIDVARFFDLPLDLFLGIGAMENNYMDVRGDLKNSAWKRRPAKDDIVLQRRKGRVRVLNDSAGRWQITRETLRYVHKLYVEDQRDYTKLPEHLRPPRELKVNDVDSNVLTTYAGLLLRELLDHFHGDTALAVGAYNGGTAKPNMSYESGVRAVAGRVRSILERAAALNGESVMGIRWLK
ncbi:MAG: hypothetical protein ABJF23_04060 [Bryobacteraceae bacterium]